MSVYLSLYLFCFWSCSPTLANYFMSLNHFHFFIWKSIHFILSKISTNCLIYSHKWCRNLDDMVWSRKNIYLSMLFIKKHAMHQDTWRIWPKAKKIWFGPFFIICLLVGAFNIFLNFNDLFGYLFLIQNKLSRKNFKLWLWDKKKWSRSSIFAAYLTFYF